jgi:hypothetical protein
MISLNFNTLPFLQEPEFVTTWYVFGIFAAIWVAWDEFKVNIHVNQALKYGWLIIVIFFSVIGLLLYLITCRPPGVERNTGKTRKNTITGMYLPNGKEVGERSFIALPVMALE